MIRQLRHLFGDEHLDLSILTIDPEWTRGYFRTVKQLHVPQLFPKFLYDTVARFDGVIACEGSMFKSKFASALTTMMVGALGLALAEEKLAVGYGGEAGAMDEGLEALVKRYVKGSLIVTRNVDISRYAEFLRYGMEWADDIDSSGDSTMREQLDAAFQAGPAAFAQTADGYRELFLRELLLKSFSGMDLMDFIDRLPYGLSPEVFDAAVTKYLRGRGAIP
jgi:hypothetical protein